MNARRRFLLMRSRSHVVRALLCSLRRLQGTCRWGRPRESCPFDMTRGDCVRERRQVVRADACCRLETRGELNQGRLAECRSKKADAERRAEDDTSGYLHNRISRRRCQARRPQDKVIAVEQGCGPSGTNRRLYYSVEVEPTNCFVNPG